ncbi:UDP-N-acetylmuramoyl-L-alanine--D-glutamate ligase [uncultured Sphaerochaeta sp.]|uniref:UDP-N-acetylmuramoyl-L-alanine--D-glutamate ligase n=1 Tax=uncultured Sphaerochaeta sp. TaxID=886478 RepID=UPI002A0A2EC8|nr:UDP-N-acetylmuramoyl-L-alanine--D-glutamate ligase [uncultured Sphaerochaeta sp.]
MKVLVFGLGMHGGGFAAASYFLDHGDEVRVTDLKGNSQLGTEVQTLEQRGAKCITGNHRAQDFRWADIVVKNPAIPPDHPLLESTKMVVNDFAWLFSSPWCEQTKIIAITGTKGKTTTSAAVAHALEKLGYEAMQCGNMGISAFTVLSDWEKRNAEGRKMPDYLVCEFSSWLIRDTYAAMRGQFPPMEICAITNFYPDHLNSYQTIDLYLADKLELFGKHTKLAVIPDVFMKQVQKLTGLDKKQVRGIDRSCAKVLQEMPHLKSAYAILLALGFKWKTILKALSSFSGVPHRIEQIGTIGNIMLVNDSAATIPEAVHFTCAKFHMMPIHLICGGTDKNLVAESMLNELKEASSISLLGGSYTKDKLIPLMEKEKIHFDGPFQTMDEAFANAYAKAEEKAKSLPELPQVVLLSPGATSFELFVNEFDRGDQFRNLANTLLDSTHAV